MIRNNFQELERLELEQRQVPEKIKRNIKSQIGFFQFIGSIFDLYIPKMIDLVIGMSGSNSSKKSGGESKSSSSKYPNL